jgi:hypothetical protein
MAKLTIIAAVAKPLPVSAPFDAPICFFAFDEQTKATIVVIGTRGTSAIRKLAIASEEVFG